jgi:hypothetical protein
MAPNAFGGAYGQGKRAICIKKLCGILLCGRRPDRSYREHPRKFLCREKEDNPAAAPWGTTVRIDSGPNQVGIPSAPLNIEEIQKFNPK